MLSPENTGMKNIKRLAMAAIIAIAAIQVSIAPQAAFAGAPATITVNTTKDDLNFDDNLCSLREAMRRAFDNDSTAVAQNDCTQSTGGSTTIKFGVSGSIVISNGVFLGTLPHVVNRVTLIGPITIDAKQLDQQLFVSHSDAIFSLVNVTIKNAKWTAISNDDGGKLQISGGKFENNSAGGVGGGAIRTNGETIIAGTEFINNKAVKKDSGESTKDGGAIRSTWKLTIAGATFKGNVADGQGGAIMAQSHSFEIADSAFTGNVAGGLPHDLDHNGDGGSYGSGGGAISFAASGNTYPSTIQRAAFQANVSLNGSGGAVFHNGGTQLTISDSSFQANHAGNPSSKGAGGAIFNVSELIVKRSSFTGNSVDGDGGALANDLGGQVKLRVAGFAANNASGKGGALLNSNLTSSEAKFDMLGVQVTGNIAGNAGGGIYNHDSKYDTAAVRGSVWAGNLPENCKDKQTSDENTPDPNDEEVWPVDSKGQNYFNDSSCDADEDEDDKNPGDPGFSPDPKLDAPAANGGVPGLLTQMPLFGSPLVDAISPDKASQDPEDQKDIRGMPRGMNGSGFGAGFWDIGSFERDDASPKFSSLPVPGSTINVGSGPVNNAFTKTAALKIYNGGDLDLTISGVTKGGANPADFVLTVNSPVSAHGAQVVDIACSPAAAGDRTATLAFTTNDPAKPSANYTLTCKGNAGAFPVMDSTPANAGIRSIDTKVGQNGNMAITFRNKGTANLSFAGAVFTADPVGGISSIGSPVPGILAPGAQSGQLYTCDTSTTGIKTARLTFTTNEAGSPSRYIDLVCTVNKAKDPLFGEHDSDTGGYGSVAGPYGIAISPDGRHVYAADEGDSAIIVDSVNPSTHMLDAASVFESSSLSANNRFTSTYQVMVSPDGRFVYATGLAADSLATFARDAESGALTHVDTVRQGSGYNCTGLFPPVCANNVTGMDGAYGMALSPDGKFVYVSSVADDSIVVFGRDPESGAASTIRLGGSGAFFKQQFTHANLNAAYGMVMSPDGANLYVTGYLSDALITLKRDPVLGTLSYQGVLLPADAAGLDGVFRVTMSADGRFVYTASFGSHSLCAFSRNTLNGALSYVDCYTSPYLSNGSDVVLSPDGKRVFVTGFSSGSLLAYARDEASGALSFSDVITTSSGAKISGARGVVIHPAGDAAYVTGNSDDRVVAIRFNQPAPQLNAVAPASVSAGGAAFPLTVKGTDFLPSSYVMLDGVQKPTQFLNSETLVATIEAADIAVTAEKNVSVFTPPAGGGLSDARKLYILAPGATPVPVIEAISLGGIPAGAVSATVDVKGAGFSPGALVIANGSGRATTFVSDKLLRATLIAADLENIGTLVISVDNAPALAMAAQNAAGETAANAQVTIGAEEAVMDNGGDEMPLDQPVQSQQAPMQSQSVSVAPSDSNFVGIDIVSPNTNPAPGVTVLAPDNAQAQGSAAQLAVTITGSGFVLGAQAYWNGEARATEFVNATTVKMTISAGDLLFGGTADVSVVNPAPGGGESSVLTFTIVEPPPQPFFYKTRLPLVRRG